MSRTILGARDKAVYLWENNVVGSVDRSRLDLRSATAVVSHVWAEMRCNGRPPVVREERISGAYANRRELVMSSAGIPTWIVLHELAHSMDMSLETSMGEYAARPEGESLSGSTHDANWLGIYLQLLSKFMPSPLNNLFWLAGTLQERGLDYTLSPTIRSR